MASLWHRHTHKSGPDSLTLNVDGIVMASIVYHTSKEAPNHPYGWQVPWGFEMNYGVCRTEGEAQTQAEEKLHRLYEKFAQVWKSPHSTKAARKQK